jgi:hypothetical protein
MKTFLISFLMLASLGCYAGNELTDTQGSLPQNSEWEDLFYGGHSDPIATLVLGYVNKDWTTDFGDHVFHENIWGQEGKRIHGFQAGVGVQPCLPMGLGIHSGLFYEFYYSVSQAVKDAGYDDFREHNLYLPLHAMYRLPISRVSSFNVYGGLGFNWAMWGSYNVDDARWYYDGTRVVNWQKYGDGQWPKHLNVQWEVGCGVRIDMVQLNFTYSRGITDHEFYKGYHTRQNKIGISLSFVLDDD